MNRWPTVVPPGLRRARVIASALQWSMAICWLLLSLRFTLVSFDRWYGSIETKRTIVVVPSGTAVAPSREDVKTGHAPLTLEQTREQLRQLQQQGSLMPPDLDAGLPADAAAHVPSGGVALSTATRLTPGQTVRMQLVVSLGPARSELYVAGHHVGQSPWIGEQSCTYGKKLRIQAIPPKGLPITTERDCRPGILNVSEVTEP